MYEVRTVFNGTTQVMIKKTSFEIADKIAIIVRHIFNRHTIVVPTQG